MISERKFLSQVKRIRNSSQGGASEGDTEDGVLMVDQKVLFIYHYVKERR